MTGCSVSCGNVVMRSISTLTSSSTSFVLAYSWTSIITTPTPSAHVDVIFLTPSMPATASSTRLITPFSTSSGDAPRYGTVTLIISTLSSGNTSIFIVRIVSRPDITMNAISRLAATWFEANQPNKPFLSVRSFIALLLSPPYRQPPHRESWLQSPLCHSVPR